MFFLFFISVSASAHYIGEYYQGGIIFWIDEADEHGLIVAVEDQSTNAQWLNWSYLLTNTIRDGIFAGKYNTSRIIEAQGAANLEYAAVAAKTYSGGGYNDWYLPSRYELNLMFNQKDIIGGFTGNKYWSSTEYPVNRLLGACVQSFVNGEQFVSLKKNVGSVRAIRSF